jgi:hypothetical protein
VERFVGVASKAPAFLLAAATVVLSVALFLPWWPTEEWRGPFERSFGSTAFYGWGWLSVAACLVSIVVTTIVVPGLQFGRRLDRRVAAWACLAGGGLELIGNVLLILAAPKTSVGLFAGQVSHGRSVGLTLAMVAGSVIIASTLPLIRSKNRPALVSFGHESPCASVG